MEEFIKIISVFTAGFFGAIVGPFAKSYYDNFKERKSAKIKNAPEVYDELIYYLIQGETSEKIKLGRLKAKLLVFGKDDVISLATDYIKVKSRNNSEHSYPELYRVINKIRDELKMGTDFNEGTLKELLEHKR